MIFGEMIFGEMIFGEMIFGEMIGGVAAGPAKVFWAWPRDRYATAQAFAAAGDNWERQAPLPTIAACPQARYLL
ncbi:MAG: hypothetical protein JOZ49_10175 [Mycolicibacterium sp.]|nr:hypothetical protein [Mycolicibacterium sp.]